MKYWYFIIAAFISTGPVLADNVLDPYGREGDPVNCQVQRTDGSCYEEHMDLPPAPEDIIALVKVNKKDKQNKFGYQVQGHSQLYWSSTRFKGITDARPEDLKHPIADKFKTIQPIVSVAASITVAVMTIIFHF